MKVVRINDLARELGVKHNLLFDALTKIGVKPSKLRSSALDTSTAEKLRKHFRRQDEGDGRNSSTLPSSQVEHAKSATFHSRSKTIGDRQTSIERGIITPSKTVFATQRIIAPRPSSLKTKNCDRFGNRKTNQRANEKHRIQKRNRPVNIQRQQASLARPAPWRIDLDLHSIQECVTESKRDFWKREDIEKLFSVSREAAQNIMGATSKVESYEGVYAVSRYTLLGLLEKLIVEGRPNRVSGIMLSSIERLSPGGLTIKILPSTPSVTSDAETLLEKLGEMMARRERLH